MELININKNAKLITKEKIFCYSDIISSINTFSSYIKENSKICIISQNKPQWIFAFFSGWKKGCINIPVDYMSSEEELEFILNDCKPDFIFYGLEVEDKIKNVVKSLNFTAQLINIDKIREKGKYKSTYVKKEKNDIAVILYTSGTTGNPKGVMLSYDNLISNIKGLDDRKIASDKDSTVAILPFHHAYPLMVNMLYPLHIGASISFIDKLSSKDILEVLKRDKISVLIGVPRLYELFHRRIFENINKSLVIRLLFKLVKIANNQKLSRIIFKKIHDEFGGNIKYFVSGGAKLDVDIAKDLWTLGLKIIEGYGLTETSPIVSFNPKAKIKIGSAGTPIKDVVIKIENGEIVVKGRNVFKGYLNKIEETKKVLKNGWFYTGDLGYIDEEGYIYITGRRKDIIVLPNGKNINPEEIELKIKKISSLVKETAVILKDNNLFLIVYPDFEKVMEKSVVNIEETIRWEIVDKYNLKAPPYERIYGFKIVKKELPKTRLGKIKRFLLENFLKEEIKPKKIKEPEDLDYRLIKDYLKKITKKEVYPDNHIEIDLGLDSLEKVEFLTFLEETFGVNIPEDELVEKATIFEIYKKIKDKKKKLEIGEINWDKVFKKTIEIDVYEKPYFLLILKYLLKPIFKIYFRLEYKGKPKENNAIYISNHHSFIDGFLIISSLPNEILKDMYFLAEESYFNTPIKRFVAKLFHVIPININKNLKETLQKTAFLLKNEKSVLIFPEGARTRDGKLIEFKKSFAILSKYLNKPVVPIVIKGAFEAFPIGSIFPKPRKIKLEYLKPIYPKGKEVDNILNIAKNEIKKFIEK